MKIEKLNPVEREIYLDAQQALEEKLGSVAFAQRFFGPTGRFAELSERGADRKELAGSQLYQWLQKQLGRLRREEAELFEREVQVAGFADKAELLESLARLRASEEDMRAGRVMPAKEAIEELLERFRTK